MAGQGNSKDVVRDIEKKTMNRKKGVETMRRLAEEDSGEANFFDLSDSECMAEGKCHGSECRYWMPAGCAIKFANEGPKTPTEIGEIMGMSRQAVDVMADRALIKLKVNAIRMFGRDAASKLLPDGNGNLPMARRKGSIEGQ